MFLVVAPSDDHNPYRAAVPRHIRQKYNIDIGDILVFNTPQGPVLLEVDRPFLSEKEKWGETVISVSADNKLLFMGSSDISVQKHGLTIGGDPELFLLHHKTGDVIEAYRYLNFNSSIGSDGQLAELRPKYSTSPEELVNNIKHMIIKMRHILPKHIKLHASSWYKGRSCGFHIHLGIPEELLLIPIPATHSIIENIVIALDFFLGVPAACIEDTDVRRMASTSYGNPGDFRLSSRTLEYRTLGGYFLSSPMHALFAYKSAFIIADRVINDMRIDSGGWQDMDKIATYDYMKDKYTMPAKKTIIDMFSWKRQKLLSLVPRLVAFSGQRDMLISLLKRREDAFPWSWYDEKDKTNIHRLGGL